jgi:flagellar basal-body rod protein FlgG
VERGLFIAAAGMLADQLRQDVIANNLANATTPGYKGDRAVGEEFNSLLLNNLQTGAPVGQLGTGARIADVVTDGSQGALRHTDNTFDLAISGDGYFAVQSAAGTRYTRDGAFTLDNRGQLSTSKGEPVLGADGRPVVVPSGGKATIDQGGRVFVNERQVATIGVTALDPQSVRKQGDDLFTGRVRQGVAPGRVEQGYLEQANVSSVHEMVDLISVMRSFESSQKASNALDETLGKAVNEIGKV